MSSPIWLNFHKQHQLLSHKKLQDVDTSECSCKSFLLYNNPPKDMACKCSQSHKGYKINHLGIIRNAPTFFFPKSCIISFIRTDIELVRPIRKAQVESHGAHKKTNRSRVNRRSEQNRVILNFLVWFFSRVHLIVEVVLLHLQSLGDGTNTFKTGLT